MKKIISGVFLFIGMMPCVLANVPNHQPSLREVLAEISGQQEALQQSREGFPSHEPPSMLSRTAEPSVGAAAVAQQQPESESQAQHLASLPLLAQASPSDLSQAAQAVQAQATQAQAQAVQAQAEQVQAQQVGAAQQAQVQQQAQAQALQAQAQAAQAQGQAQAQQNQQYSIISGQQTTPQPIALPDEAASRLPSGGAASPTMPAVTQTMSPEQFQQWLHNNGYTQSREKPRETVTTTTTTTTKSLQYSQAANAISTFQPVAKPKTATTHRSSHASHGSYLKPKVLNYEQGQRVMLKSVPKSHIPPIPDANVAFNMMLQQNMPLTPQQVVQLRQQIDIAQRAAATLPNIPPKPVSSTVMVNLAPGTTPPAVRLAQGYVSSLVFVDSTSQPWPIAAFDIGNPKAVNIQWDGKSNILLLQAVSAYSDGDIVIRLVGNPTPITLELIAGQRVVDYRVDLHVPGLGPNSKDIPMGTALPNNPNQLLLGVLDGISPAGSRTLTVHGADAQAWLLGEKLYLRTRLTLLSPGWMATMVSPDGMHAYELPKTSSILVSRYGEPAELKIEGF